MATFDPPREIVPIFNPTDWLIDDPLTVAEGDGRYLKLNGGTEKGPVVFNQDITIKEDINFTDGTDNYTIGIDGLGDLQIGGTGELRVTTDGVNMEGETLNMSNGEIHKVPLIHGPNNVDLVIEGKGTGDVILKTGNVDRVVVEDNGNIAIDTNVLYVDAVNNRVGVGTTTPQARLEVAGGAMYINGAESRFWNTTYTDPDAGVARAVKISGNGLALNGGCKMDLLDVPLISRTGTTNINSNQNNSEVVPCSITTNALGSGRSCTLRLGVNTVSSYNSCQLTHFYNGNGSSNNRLDFGFYGVGARMSLRGDGCLGVGTTSPNASFRLDTFDGFIKTRNICFKVFYDSAGQTNVPPNSYFLNGATVSFDHYPTSLGSFGFQTSGSYQGQYRFPLTGVYQVQIMVRFVDSTAQMGLVPKIYDGSNYTNIITMDDNTVWSPTDGSSHRRVLCYTDIISATQGHGLVATSNANVAFEWAMMSVSLVYAS